MNINGILKEYLDAKEQENAAKKRAEKARDLILEHTKGKSFVTDEYTVLIENRPSVRLDGKKLEKDFPGIKDPAQYGIVSYSTYITITAAEDIEKSA